VVFAGVGGIYASRHDWPGMFGVLLAPVPSIIVVFLQRVKASNRRKLKGACGGLGWGFVSFLAYLIWHSLMMEMNYWLAQGESSWTGE